MTKIVPLLCLVSLSAGCGAGNGNGHERSGNGIHERDDTRTTEEHSAPSASLAMATSDGQWWCFGVNRPTPRDGHSSCVRTRDYCETVREHAEKVGREPTQCTSQASAFCFIYSYQQRSWSERCLKTGPQCDELYHRLRKRADIEAKPCAEQKNDVPPAGGVY